MCYNLTLCGYLANRLKKSDLHGTWPLVEHCLAFVIQLGNNSNQIQLVSRSKLYSKLPTTSLAHATTDWTSIISSVKISWQHHFVSRAKE